MARNPVIDEILRQGRKKPRSQVAAALETGRVESGFKNLPGGDSDSVNWRQERASIYGGDMSISRSVKRFYSEAAQLDRGQPSYQLAADVQRPAAQYRGRYKGAQNEALQLLRGGSAGSRPAGGSAPSTPGTPGTPARTTTTSSQQPTFDQAGFDQAQRRQKVATFLQQHGRGNSVLFRTGAVSTAAVDPAQFTGSETVTSTKTTPGTPGTPAGAQAASVDAGPSTGDVSKAIGAATKRLGLYVEDRGSNRGRKLDQLEGSFGQIGQPWCGYFAGRVLQQAGVQGVDGRIGSVAEIERMARAGEGAFKQWVSGRQLRAGDLVVPRQGSHVAVVTKVHADGRVDVIGGNNSKGTVGRATYNASAVHGGARPRYR